MPEHTAISGTAPPDRQRVKHTIDLTTANIFGALLFIPAILLYGIPWYLLWGSAGLSVYLTGMDAAAVLVFSLSATLVFLVGVILHEAIHGLTWARYAENGLRSIRFGIIRKMLTPYCHCTEPLQIRHYLLGALMPALVLGLLPGIAAIATGSSALLLFGIFFTVAAGGDLMMIHLLKDEKMDDLVQDHPSEVGCYVYRKQVT